MTLRDEERKLEFEVFDQLPQAVKKVLNEDLNDPLSFFDLQQILMQIHMGVRISDLISGLKAVSQESHLEDLRRAQSPKPRSLDR